jgi:3-methylfumaryl-CoA hydratase
MSEIVEGVRRVEACSLAAVRRVAAMLDLDPEGFAEGDPLPRGWHFVLMGADTPKGALRADGFPGLGVVMPDLGLPRLMLGGRTVSYRRDIPIGATVHRTSAMKSIVRKDSDAGPMAIATIAHELRNPTDDEPAVIEEQTYLLLGARKAAVQDRAAAPPPPTDERKQIVVPDDTLLFQYSALGFNSHKIHLDRDHARDVEGFPDLVVNGGLATLLLTEFLRRDLGCTPSAALKVRHLAPLYCNRPITLTARREPDRWRLRALDDNNFPALEMEVETP